MRKLETDDLDLYYGDGGSSYVVALKSHRKLTRRTCIRGRTRYPSWSLWFDLFAQDLAVSETDKEIINDYRRKNYGA